LAWFRHGKLCLFLHFEVSWNGKRLGGLPEDGGKCEKATALADLEENF
jgi:hypothetical protein